MKKTELQLLKSLRGFLRKQKVECLIENEKQWEELFSLARSHKVLPMIYDSMGTSGMIEHIPLKLQGIWKNTAWQELVMQIQKDRFFLSFYEKIVSSGIKCLVVKGVICRNLYPKPDARISSDEDLFISRKEFKKFKEVCYENGFECIHSDGREWDFIHKENGLKLEVHLDLFDEQSKSYAELNLPFKKSIEHAIEYEINGVRIWTMNETDHLLYLILHSFKHFLHSGVGIRQICDIVMFAEHFGSKIRWKDVFAELRKVNAAVFMMNMLDIGKKYLGFSYKKAAIPEELLNRYKGDIDSADLLADFLQAGVYGTSSESRTHSSLITLNAVAASKERKSSKGSLLKTIFPDRHHMSIEYPILKKHGYLLPVMWVIRICKYVGSILIDKNKKANSAIESIQIGNKRIGLLKKYKVISK